MTADIWMVYFLYNCAVFSKYAIMVLGCKSQLGAFEPTKLHHLQLLLAPVRLWLARHVSILVLGQELLRLEGCHATGAWKRC